MPSDFREEELFHLEKEEKEGQRRIIDALTMTIDSGPFSDDFTGRYVEKEFFEDEQDDLIVHEVLMQVFTAQSQFHEIFGRKWGSGDHRDLGSLLLFCARTCSDEAWYPS